MSDQSRRTADGGDEGSLALAETTTPELALAQTTASDAGADSAPSANLATLDPARATPSTASPLERLPVVDRDRYKVAGEVARGGLGRILRARDRHLERTVALKEMLGGGAEAEARFVREALITARLEHPSIVPVHDAGRGRDGAPFYAMKLVRGKPLVEVIADATTTTARLALVPTVLAVADAIAYAHSERVIHRDLKPANVLVGEFGETVVIDWGLAKDLDAGEVDAEADTDVEGVEGLRPPATTLAGRDTVVGAILGTPAYMAPEQAAGGDVDERADVYALGAILYELMAGTPPHRGRTLDEVLRKVIAGDLVPVQTRAPDVPRDLAAIVAKAMQREPADRYPSARELAADLRRYVHGQLVAVYQYRWRERVIRWLRRNRAPVAVASVAAALMLVSGVIAVRRIIDERDQARAARAVAVKREGEARRAERSARVRADELLIAQARDAVEADPTRAMAILASLPADSTRWSAARMVAADALARGVGDVLVGHPYPTAAIAIDGDGDRIASADHERIRLWDLAAGTVRAIALPAPCGDATECSYGGWQLSLSHDHLAAGAGMVYVWELADLGRKPKEFPGERAWVVGGGKVVIAPRTGDAAGLVIVDLQTGASSPLLDGPADAWLVARDGSAAVAVEGERLRWRTADGQVRTVPASAEPSAIALSASGRVLTWAEGARTADGRTTARARTQLSVWTADQPAGRSWPVSWPRRLTVAADDRTITWEDDDGTAWLSLDPELDLRGGAAPAVERITALRPGPSGDVVIAAGDGGIAVVRDGARGQALIVEPRRWQIATSDDGRQLAAAAAAVVRRWTIGAIAQASARPPRAATPPTASGKRPLSATETTPELATSVDGNTLVIDWIFHPVEVWRRHAGELSRIATLDIPEGSDLSVSPDGRQVLFVDVEGAAVIAIEGGEVRRLGDGQLGWFDQAGNAYTVGDGQVIQRWTADGKAERVCPATDGWANVLISGDGSTVTYVDGGVLHRCRLASGTTDAVAAVGALDPWANRFDGGAIAGYDPAERALVVAGDGARKTLPMPATPRIVRSSPDGRWVLALATEGGFTIWSTVDGSARAVAVPGKVLTEVAFLPGDVAAIASDGEVIAVDLATGVSRILQTGSQPETVWGFPDGAIMAPISGEVRLWIDDLPHDPATLRAHILAATNARLGASGELVMAAGFRELR